MNPYKVLQLEPEADKQDVKKAYFKLIRQYPPEKEPEKFKEIREAYEYLQNETNFENAQKILILPEKYKIPYNQVLEWIREEKYDKAAELCEYVLNIQDILEFRILLGRSYILNGNSGKAVKLWEGLHNSHKDNTDYLEQLGDAYAARGWNNKAFQIYYELYEKNIENLPFFEKLLDIATQQEKDEQVCEIAVRIFSYYRDLEKHSREEAEVMSNILFMISNHMSCADEQWLIRYADEMLGIMTEVPMEFKIYENTLFNNYYDLTNIMDDEEIAEQKSRRYMGYILKNENSISLEHRNDIINLKAECEEDEITEDVLIHDIIKETASLWYALFTSKKELENEKVKGFRLIHEIMGSGPDESHVYDTLLYIVNKLNEIKPSLERIKEKYPIMREALGEHFDEMLDCSNLERLFRKYERKYKRIMGYPADAKLTLEPDSSNDSDFGFDFSDNEPYRRESPKIGRNDPCPCGSGKKYKKCCGKEA